MKQEKKKRLALEHQKQKQICNHISRQLTTELEKSYHHLQMESLESPSLILPAITSSFEGVVPTNITQCQANSPFERLTLHSYIKAVTCEKDKAIEEARNYRDLAESYKRECHHIENKMYGKLECMQNFWRNNIVEGSSRSGRMVLH